MQLPVQFPSDFAVIAEEAERFRSLSAPERLQTIRSVLNAGELMLRNARRAEFLQEYSAQQESAFRSAVTDFLARHADKIMQT